MSTSVNPKAIDSRDVATETTGSPLISRVESERIIVPTEPPVPEAGAHVRAVVALFA